MKKTTFVLFIIFLSLFISANVAVAKGWKYFKGTYAMSATGSCIHSENGYDWDSFIDALPGVVYAGTTVSNGTWVFKRDGTGTYSYTMYATVTPPVQQPEPQDPPCTIPGGIRIFEANEYNFTYEITSPGKITIETQEGDTLEGSISMDKKAIILLDNLREKGPGAEFCPWYNIICTATRTLIWVHY